MAKNPFAPLFEDLPEQIPVFPLSGVLLLPGGRLPLNIFEPQYIEMVDDAMRKDKLIGIIQPKTHERKTHQAAEQNQDNDTPDPSALNQIGCLGKIIEYTETTDGRYEIALQGICRFEVVKEVEAESAYRQAQVSWSGFEPDLNSIGCLKLDREKLHTMLENYFEHEGLGCDWEKIEAATDEHLITCLSMICPFSAEEKQALLEAPCCRERGKLFLTVLEIAIKSSDQTFVCSDAKH